MRKQPDFQALFFDYFGDTPKRVDYHVRENSCRYHDVIFLTSLIHDARLRRSRITQRGTRLTIPLERDCWELYREPHDGLYTTTSKLLISPVISMEW